jgi:hypothetical protein
LTVNDYITTFLAEHDHPYTNTVVLKWINLCESNIDHVKTYLSQYYARTLNVFQYDLPTSVSFEDVKSLYVNRIKYKKKDVRAHRERHVYWFEDGKLCINPACPENDLSYTSEVGGITFTDAKITTTGADFGFAAGDTVLISGATESANNKHATVIGTGTKELTFASGTFTAGAEANALTIARPKIRLIYESKPATKLIANITTDTLFLPDRWVDVYDYFLMAKIAYLAKEYADYNNHMQSFNAAVARYEDWYGDHRPQNPDDEIVAAELDEFSGRTGFDYE